MEDAVCERVVHEMAALRAYNTVLRERFVFGG